MQKRTVAFSRNCSNVFFHLLTACNLACRHCYINVAQHGENTLDIDTIRRWLDIFAARAPSANLILLGGEPTLHPELADVIRYAGKRAFGSVTVDTNGFLFHDILERVDPGEIDFFSFSLDGATPATNDAIRGRGTYERCIAGMRRAAAKGFATSLIYTVSRLNLHELESMAALVKDLGITRFFIQVIGLRGASAEDARARQLQLSRREWLDTVPAAAARIAAQGVIVTYPKVFLTAGELFECAGRVADNYFVFPNGRVYRCPLCEDYPLNALAIENNRLVEMPPINESHLFALDIPEGCVINRLVQPQNLAYDAAGVPDYRIACCMLKEEIFVRQ